MFAPHLKAGAGAAAEALAATLTVERRPVAMGETTLLLMLVIGDSIIGEEATRTDDPTTLHDAGMAIFEERPAVAILMEDFIERAIV